MADETFELLQGFMVPVGKICQTNQSSLWKVSPVLDRSSIFACKIFSISSVPANKYESLVENLQLVQHMFHPNIIRHLKVLGKPEWKIYLIMDYYERGSIGDLLEQRKKPLDEKSIRVWMSQIIGAVSYLHSKGIAHRKLNLNTILIASDTMAILSGFINHCIGFRRGIEIVRTTTVNSPGYRAPEIHPFSTQIWPYDAKASDIYALGVCLYRLANYNWPFDIQILERDPVQYTLLQRQKKYSMAPGISANLKNLINRMLEPLPGIRITAKQAIIHRGLISEEQHK